MSLVPVHIENLSPYKPGKPISHVKRELGLKHVIKLASNENPSGPSPLALDAVKNALFDYNRYPDSAAFNLRNRLAIRFNVKVENVILGAGSEGIMSTIMRTFLRKKDEIIAAKNSFIGFRVLANASGFKTNWISMENYHHNLASMAKAINDQTKIIYLANPDNPTGTYFNVKKFDAFMSKVPDRVLVLLDEAYFEYAKDVLDYPDSMHYRYDNVITLRTFSKAYGLAGFRIGYGFAHEDIINNLMKVKLPFEPSTPAQIAAIAALGDKNYLQSSLKLNKEGIAGMKKLFDEYELDYIPTIANFLTLVFKNEKSAKSFCKSMLQRGVILRYLSGFGLPECVRVTTGTQEENTIFFDHISRISKKKT
jgi:histidinol-phosphate aminotransferase